MFKIQYFLSEKFYLYKVLHNENKKIIINLFNLLIKPKHSNINCGDLIPTCLTAALAVLYASPNTHSIRLKAFHTAESMKCESW